MLVLKLLVVLVLDLSVAWTTAGGQGGQRRKADDDDDDDDADAADDDADADADYDDEPTASNEIQPLYPPPKKIDFVTQTPPPLPLTESIICLNSAPNIC